MEKSHVGMGEEVCAICGAPHSSSVLLDRRLRETLPAGVTVCTGNDPCSLCQEKIDAGYVALVEVDEKKSGTDPNTENARIMPGDAWRTGPISWLRASAWHKVFNVPLPDPPLCFVGSEVTAILEKLQPPEAGADGKD